MTDENPLGGETSVGSPPGTSAGTEEPPPPSQRGWVFDLLMVACLSSLAAFAILFPLTPRPIRWLAGIPLLVFLPGYAYVAVLFPERSGVQTEPSAPESANGPPGIVPKQASRAQALAGGSPSWIARIMLSLVLSPIIVAGVALALSPLHAIRLVPVVLILTGIILFGCVVALGRRRVLSPADRARPLESVGPHSVGLLSSSYRVHNVALILSLALLGGAVVFAVSAPTNSAAYTETYLLSEENVADGFSTDLTSGSEETVRVGIENQENERVTYEVVIVLQEVADDGTVEAQEQLDRFEVTLEDGEQTVESSEVSPTMTGESLRMQVLVFSDDPAGIDQTSADQVLQLWVSVTE